LIFGFRLRQGYGGQVVSAQSQGFANLLLHRSLAKNQKSSLHTATSFLSTLYPIGTFSVAKVDAILFHELQQ
jgi:hypothetical protein